jgi:2-dehydro-3-deoxygalactonokinase
VIGSGLFVAGDWGTSHLRLFLCRGTQVLDRREGAGIARIAADPETHSFPATLSELLAPWMREHGNLRVWFAGMVGSRNGWRETKYVPAPADTKAVAAAVLHFNAGGMNVAIAPGLSCTNPLGAPDLMRGEETQIFGALVAHPERSTGRHVFVLPGTHTKWALVEDGRIILFQTTFTGELFGLLTDHSMLMRAGNSPALSPERADEAGRSGFELGLARVRKVKDVPLTHLLFEARSRQIAGEWSQPQALGFLSG